MVDPNGIVPVQLELGGREKGQSVTFAGLNLRRFTGIRDHRIAEAPPIDHPIVASAGDRIVLNGYKIADNGDLLLFWQRPSGGAPAGDLRMALESRRAGAPVALPADRRLGGYTYPTSRWPAGEIVTGVVPAQEWLGAAPPQGVYSVAVRVYDSSAPAAPLRWEDGSAELHIENIEVAID